MDKRLSIIFLAISNIFVIILAALQNWNLTDVIWIYFSQSIIIGLFTSIRLLSFNGLVQKGRYFVPPEKKERLLHRIGAILFLIIYTYLHYSAYYILRDYSKTALTSAGYANILIGSLLFLITYLISFISTKSHKEKLYVLIFVSPLWRILPLTLTILLGILFSAQETVYSISILLILKTLIDIYLQNEETKDRKTLRTINTAMKR